MPRASPGILTLTDRFLSHLVVLARWPWLAESDGGGGGEGAAGEEEERVVTGGGKGGPAGVEGPPKVTGTTVVNVWLTARRRLPKPKRSSSPAPAQLTWHEEEEEEEERT